MLWLLIIIPWTLNIGIEISFTPILRNLRIIISRNLDLYLLLSLIRLVILLSKRFILCYLTFKSFILECFIFYCFLRSLNCKCLVLKWVFYLYIFLLLALIYLFILILNILWYIYCFIHVMILYPFFLFNLCFLWLPLCSWSSWIDNIFWTTTGNKTAFILHEFLKQFGVFDRIQIYLTVILVLWFDWHFLSLKFDLTYINCYNY